MIDNVDRNILAILQKNARVSNAQIGRELNLAPSGIHERIKKLEARGIIKGYGVCLDSTKLGYDVTAYLFIKSSDRPDDTVTAKLLSNIPEVEEVHHIAGEDCFLVKLRSASNKDLGRLLREEIGSIESVISTRTSIVLGTTKEGGLLPVLEPKKNQN